MTQAQPKGAGGGAGRLLPPQKNHNVAAVLGRLMAAVGEEGGVSVGGGERVEQLVWFEEAHKT